MNRYVLHAFEFLNLTVFVLGYVVGGALIHITCFYAEMKISLRVCTHL